LTALLALVTSQAFSGENSPAGTKPNDPSTTVVSLKQAFSGAFLVGAAVSNKQILGGEPEAVSRAQSDRYVDLFRILLAHKDQVARVTFWGVHNGQSWKNGWPMEGRTDYPLLFDRNYQPRQVYYEIIELTTQR
jgi:hypothetical protein